MQKVVQLRSAVTSLCVEAKSGDIIMSTENGDLLRLIGSEKTGRDPEAELLLKSGGTPYGITYGQGSRMFICDVAQRALLTYAVGEDIVNIVDEYEEESLHGPNSVITDSNNTIYFTDSGPLGTTTLGEKQGSVFAISGEDHVLHPLALNCLAHPAGIALSPDENVIYVAETLANRILRFVQKPEGVFQFSVFHQFSGQLGPVGLAVDGSGNLYVTRAEAEGLPTNGLITILNAMGKEVGSIDSTYPEVGAIAIGPQQNPYIFVAETSTKVFIESQSMISLCNIKE